MEAWDHEPEQPQDCCRDGYEPEPCQLDPAGRALSIIPGGDYSYEGALHRDGSDLYRAAADHLAKLTHYVEWTTWDEYHGMETVSYTHLTLPTICSV